jgi:hypothetical protein
VGSPADRPDGAWRQAGLVVVAGLATGVLTQLGQGILPEGWSQAANAISPWLLVAFLVGSAMPDARSAAIAGISVLVLAIVGYDLAILVQYGYGPSPGPRVLWGTGAIAGGLAFGTAGRWWRAGSDRRRALGLGLLVAVFVGEGIYNATVLANPAVGAGFVIVGLLVPLALGRSRDDRLGAYAAALPCLALGGVLGYLAFAWLSGWTSGV